MKTGIRGSLGRIAGGQIIGKQRKDRVRADHEQFLAAEERLSAARARRFRTTTVMGIGVTMLVAFVIGAVEQSAKLQSRLIEDRAAFDTMKPAADAKGLALPMSVDTAEARITGDGTRLKQVF